MEKWIEERIEENKELFTDEELKTIDNNFAVIKKIYILGMINTKK